MKRLPLASGSAAHAPEPTRIHQGRRRRRRGRGGASRRPGCDLPAAEGSTEPKNVLLLIVDSLRPDHVGAYGSPQIQTPTIDSLAARGLRFNRAFPEAMVTLPARRSIFTEQPDLPLPQLQAEPGARDAAPAGSRSRTPSTPDLHVGAQARRLLDGAGERQPVPRLHRPVQALPQELRPLGHDRRPVRLRATRRARCRWRRSTQWLPPVLRDDRYMPGHAQVPRQHRARA